MENFYDKNGLIFWTQEEIKLRKMFEEHLVSQILFSLRKQNAAFQMVQIEAPLLTPREFINKNYTEADIYVLEDLALRPETTMGSFAYAKQLLSGYNEVKQRPPVVIWQHGKSFRREQDQPSKFMRLKEFYQLEFQIIFGATTANDYSLQLYPDIQKTISGLIGECKMEPSDRLPDYSEETMDIVCLKSEMEVCSMSKRKDFPNKTIEKEVLEKMPEQERIKAEADLKKSELKVIEIAIGTDRLIYNFQDK